MIFTVHSHTLYFTRGLSVNVDLGVGIPHGVTALVGPNGAGKTTFGRILESGRNFRTNNIEAHIPNPRVRYMEFNDVHSLTGTTVQYYQQRYETSMNDDVPTVGQALGAAAHTPRFDTLAHAFNLDNPLCKKVNHLSSGELRKLLLINALHDSPHLLILDNPYIGLDTPSRQALNDAIRQLPAAGTAVLLLIADMADRPEWVDHTLYARDLTVSGRPHPAQEPMSVPQFRFHTAAPPTVPLPIVELKDCTVRHGNRTLVEHLDWTVTSSQRWSLSGPNGSGKSTLLSLICADNPRSYSTSITLFGRRRGTGESIWDIKRCIGYVSPEMQLHFHTAGTLLHVVASGLNDTQGLYIKPTPEQQREAMRWLEHFRLDNKAHAPMAALSAGERQLALVARSFIKQPRLLVLDEPMHALDSHATTIVRSTIDDFAQARPDAAIIIVSHNPAELPLNITHNLTLPLHAS